MLDKIQLPEGKSFLLMSKKYKVGVIVGRFQPFHLGHKYLIEKALEKVDGLYIILAATNLKDDDNPYDAKKRLVFLKKFIKEEGLGKKITKVIPLKNHPDDNVWLANLLKKTGKVDIVIGNNDWVNGIFENANISSLRIKHYKRNILEGTKIRKLMKENKKWQSRVPKYLLSSISKV